MAYPDINNLVLTGRLADEPQLRMTPAGTPVLDVDLAVNRPMKEGGEQPPADFIPVTYWGKLANVVAEHLHKGSEIAVEGELRADRFVDKEGKNRKKVFVVARKVKFLGRKGTVQSEAEGEPPENPSEVTA